MIIITQKKNRVSIYGKTFHVTPAGKILPLGAKKNWFTKCMSEALKGKQKTGEDLTQVQLKANKTRFKTAVKGCVPTPKPKTKAA